jgi:ectoine hydroxylase-related dioxygenase (phytanoyl-CoA dioxygenase family)
VSTTFAETGFEIVRSVLPQEEIDFISKKLDSLLVAAGHRNLAARIPAVRDLAHAPKIIELVEKRAGAKPFLVRSIFFDKTVDTNELAHWHQETTIAVHQRLNVPGYLPWSVKEGVPHVQPPRGILETMITLRLHLDDCDATNGALKVIPRSHRMGKLNTDEITAVRKECREVLCAAQAGDGLFMRPLLLHASSRSSNAAHRRVLHLDYATAPLAGGLEWSSEP